MPTLTQGQSVTLQMSEGESWTVTPTGQAQISTRGVSGGPLQAPTTIATATTFGPYAESGTLTIFAMTGSATYTGSELSALVSGAGNLVGVADALPPVSNVTAAVGAAGSLTGAYYYSVAFLLDDGTVTPPWVGTATVVNPSSQQVNLTDIPISSSSRVVGRVLLRTAATPTDPKAYQVLTTINDNTTTTYTDNAADGSLGAGADWLGSCAGVLTTSSGSALRGLGAQSNSLAAGYGSGGGYASCSYGAFSQQVVTTGRRNNTFGVYAGALLTTGYEHALFGTHAGNNLTTQSGNTMIGVYAGQYGGTGAGASNLNTLVGNAAGQGTNGTGLGSQLVAVGYRALQNINTADSCVGIGSHAGRYANASRQLFIDSGGDRSAIAGCQDVGLIYGQAASGTTATVAGTQQLRLNAATRIGWGTAVVANLPAASAALKGYRAYVTDASVAYTSANVGSTVASGGSNTVPVFCNGANWVIG